MFLAKTPRGNAGAVAAAAELGQSLDPLLPYREDRPPQWWQGGTTTAAGYTLWDAGLAADTSDVREIVLIAAADRDAELSAWTWSDGTPQIPPFARYLLHAAKLRYEARLLDAWHRDSRAPSGPGGMPADQDATAPPGAQAELIRAELSRLGAEHRRLDGLETDLRTLRQTVTIARDNLRTVAAGDTGDNSAGMFPADQALANWLLLQTGDDLSYLEIDMNRITRARTLAADDLAQLERADGSGDSHAVSDPGQPASATQHQDAAGASGADQIARRVFIVHGRDGILVSRFRDLLRAVDLQPLEWETLVRFTGSTVVERLKQADCSVDDSGTDWLDPARFAGLAAYRRGPGTHRGDR